MERKGSIPQFTEKYLQLSHSQLTQTRVKRIHLPTSYQYSIPLQHSCCRVFVIKIFLFLTRRTCPVIKALLNTKSEKTLSLKSEEIISLSLSMTQYKKYTITHLRLIISKITSISIQAFFRACQCQAQ